MTPTDHAVAGVLAQFNDPAVRAAMVNVRNAFARFDAGLARLEGIALTRMAGRVPAQDIFADAPGYAPGVSASILSLQEAKTGGPHEVAASHTVRNSMAAGITSASGPAADSSGRASPEYIGGE